MGARLVRGARGVQPRVRAVDDRARPRCHLDRDDDGANDDIDNCVDVGVYAKLQPFRIKAIAIYDAIASCPAPIIR